MPTWTTHTEGGSWSGGGTDVRDCSTAMQLRALLVAKWETIEIDCTDSDCSSLDGRFSGNKILICVTSRPRIDAVLLHELVHAVGGTELDSEAVEHACFAGSEATAPFGDDWDLFRSETSELDGEETERVGEFVIWNSETGEVWGKETEGGSWSSSGTTVKGDLCFQSDDWEHDYGGGGWI